MPGLSLFEAAALGVAGHSVGVALELMFRNGLTPDKGPVAVTGATGAVGSYAIDVLSRLGFEVVALTRKPGEAEYLHALGASDVIDSRSIDAVPKPLLNQRWAGAMDSVGGEQLAWLIATAKRDGVIASNRQCAEQRIPGERPSIHPARRAPHRREREQPRRNEAANMEPVGE